MADSLGESIASCIAPTSDEPHVFTDSVPEDEGYFEAIAYSVSELVKNVQQHSMGDGYIVAQYYPRTDMTKIAIVDNGIGIRDSFKQSDSPFHNRISNDLDAIRLALEPEVSSKNHTILPYCAGPENAGVGLTLLSNLSILTKGCSTLISGRAILSGSGVESCVEEGFAGTFASFSFNRSDLDCFLSLLEQMKAKILGEEPSSVDGVDVDSIFED